MNHLEKSQFNTRLLSADQRFTAWKESISVLFDVTLPQAGCESNFNASLDSYLINDQCMLSRCDTGAQRFERTATHVLADGLDYYLIQTMLSGSQRVRRGRKDSTATRGGLLVIDLAANHSATTSNFINLSLVVPRHLLAPALSHPDNHASRVIDGSEPLATLVASHLQTLAGVMHSLSPAVANHTIEPTLQLLASALNGSLDSVEGGLSAVSRSLLLKAKATIENNLHRDLSAEKLSAQLRVSRATLYRLFEPLAE